MTHGGSMLLVTLVAGYWVLERAETHKGDLKKLGRFLGGLIIVASLAGLVCRLWGMASSCPIGMGGTAKRGVMCPFTSGVR